MSKTKTGRPRRYDLRPAADATGGEAGGYLSALDELSERVFDQISDLSGEALSYLPPGSYLSIGKLVRHMAGAESGWITRLSGCAIPPELARALEHAGRSELATAESPPLDASGLIALCRRVREEVTRPVLTGPIDLDAPMHERIRSGSGPVGPSTARQAVMHILWHWVYHSGHIGLTRLLWGSEYDWTFAE